MPARDRPLSPARATFSTQPRFNQSARHSVVENKGPAGGYRIDPVAREKPAIKKDFVYRSRAGERGMVDYNAASQPAWCFGGPDSLQSEDRRSIAPRKVSEKAK